MTISTQLDGLKEFRFKAVLDSKDIEAIKAEQKTLKEDYEQHLNKHKETLNQLGDYNYRGKLAVGWHRLLSYCEGKVHIEGKIVSILLMN